MRLAIWILWPSFLVGAVANAIFFSVFDPATLHPYWDAAPASRMTAYTIGFFACWAVGVCSSAFTCFLQRDANQVNRSLCPLDDTQRPPGCRGDGNERLT